MEASAQNLEAMAHYLRQTVSPDPAVRKGAEKFIGSVEAQQNFALVVLQLVGSDNQPMDVRMAAAILFKNFVRRHWAQSEDTVDIISPDDRTSVKTVIISLMLSVQSSLQKQLSEALTIIADHDFPHRWENLLKELVTKMATQDFQLINGVLQTAHSIFKRYRHQYQSDTLFLELKLALDHFALPLLELLKATDLLIQQHAADKPSLEILFNSLLFITKIFYSLSFQDLPAFFEDHLQTFFTLFLKYLTYDNPLLHTISEEDSGPLELVRSAICQIIQHYIQRYEEAAPLIPSCVQSVWTLLNTTTLDAKADELVSHAIHVLTSVASQPRHRDVFLADPSTISSLIERIILPNMRLRESDEELFEDNPVEYIRRDMEGSDAETRRRASLDLVRALNEMSETHVSDVCLSHLAQLLSRADFLSKSTAMFLFTSLAVKSTVQMHGATAIHPKTNVMDFYVRQVLPILQNQPTNLHMLILKADALRFIYTFRQHITVDALYQVFPVLIQHLGIAQLVIQSYASILLEKLLSIKRDDSLVFHRAVLQPYLSQLLSLLFNLMPEHLTPEKAAEQDHAMKATLRLILTCRGEDMEMSLRLSLLKKLSALLLVLARNPSNPKFNHYLFESLAALIAFSDKSNEQLLESHLFPVFQNILQNDVAEFMPYLFQLLALLLEKCDAISAPYAALFPLLLLPPLWTESSYVPGLCRLLRAYIMLSRTDRSLMTQHMNAILGIFQKLLANRNTDHEGFYLLCSLIQYTYEETVPFLKPLWMLILSRLQSSRTSKFVRCTAVVLSLSCVQNTRQLQALLDDIQPRLFLMLLQSILLNKEEIERISRKDERDMVAIGLTVLLTEHEFMLEDPYVSLYASLFSILLSLLSSKPLIEKEETGNVVEDIEPLEGGYSTSHSQLAYAKQPPMVPPKHIKDVESFFVKQLHDLAKAHPSRFPLVMGKVKVDQPQLVRYLDMAGVSQLV